MDPNLVAELRNQIVTSTWIMETAPQLQKSSGLGESDIQSLAALMIKDTVSEQLHSCGWGGRTTPGDYRNIPITVRSNHLRVFPYPQEVPALMEQFIRWRDDVHNKKLVHPLILACHSFVYFESIHPLIDGNGRVGRTLMQDYLLRQGYLPVIYEDLDRGEYIQAVSGAADGEPDAFVRGVLSAQLTMMKKMTSRT
jgi:Fic family protein